MVRCAARVLLRWVVLVLALQVPSALLLATREFPVHLGTIALAEAILLQSNAREAPSTCTLASKTARLALWAGFVQLRVYFFPCFAHLATPATRRVSLFHRIYARSVTSAEVG